jgi:hypothetical protein
VAKGVVSNTLEGTRLWLIVLKFGIEVVALSSSTDFCLSRESGHRRRLT